MSTSKKYLSIVLGVVFAAYFVGSLWLAYKTATPYFLKVIVLLLNIGVIYFSVKWKTWKASAVFLAFYVVWVGFLGDVPVTARLQESIRNLYFHVALWMSMAVMLLTSMIYAIRYLRKGNLLDDVKAVETANAGILFGILGLSTGAIWARATWGDFWHWDPKQTAALVGELIYFAYLILRSSIDDEVKRARISSIYNIFAFPLFVALIYILPRMSDTSLHPGAEGNPGLSSEDTDDNMKLVYYPAIFAWTLLAVWMASVRVRIQKISLKRNEII